MVFSKSVNWGGGIRLRTVRAPCGMALSHIKDS